MTFANPRILTERELSKEIKLSVFWLQKDRITARLIPFIRIGRSIRYDLAKVHAALATGEEGGPVVAKRRGVAA